MKVWIVKGKALITYLEYCDCGHCDGHEKRRSIKFPATLVDSDEVEVANEQGANLPNGDDSPEEVEQQDILNAAINKFLMTTYIGDDIGNWTDLEEIGWQEATVSEAGEDVIMRMRGMPSLFDIPGLPSTGAALPSTSGGA